MFQTKPRVPTTTPLSPEFLRWQVLLRNHTMQERNGAPHAGVAPLLSVRRAGAKPAVSTHSIIVGILPAAEQLERKTEEFRTLYEEEIGHGSRALYDRGIEYLKTYYRDASSFDPHSITTMLSTESPALVGLEADPQCSLIFYVFDLDEKAEWGRFRCLQLDCTAVVHRRGPVYDNVWWHNALFHGKEDGMAVVQFLHRRTYDTRFGRLELVT